MKRGAAIAGGTLVLLAVGIGLGLPNLFASGPGGPLPQHDKAVSALDSGMSSADALPPEVLASETVAQFDTPIDSEAAGEVSGLKVYVVDGVGDSLCLVQTAGEGRGLASATACSPTDVLDTEGAIWIHGMGVTPAYTVAGIAADGYEHAALGGAEAPIVNNVFVLQPGQPDQTETLQLAGPHVPPAVVQVEAPVAPPAGAAGVPAQVAP